VSRSEKVGSAAITLLIATIAFGFAALGLSDPQQLRVPQEAVTATLQENARSVQDRYSNFVVAVVKIDGAQAGQEAVIEVSPFNKAGDTLPAYRRLSDGMVSARDWGTYDGSVVVAWPLVWIAIVAAVLTGIMSLIWLRIRPRYATQPVYDTGGMGYP
jgi:hypothetical protein